MVNDLELCSEHVRESSGKSNYRFVSIMEGEIICPWLLLFVSCWKTDLTLCLIACTDSNIIRFVQITSDP